MGFNYTNTVQNIVGFNPTWDVQNEKLENVSKASILFQKFKAWIRDAFSFMAGPVFIEKAQLQAQNESESLKVMRAWNSFIQNHEGNLEKEDLGKIGKISETFDSFVQKHKTEKFDPLIPTAQTEFSFLAEETQATIARIRIKALNNFPGNDGVIDHVRPVLYRSHSRPVKTIYAPGIRISSHSLIDPRHTQFNSIMKRLERADKSKPETLIPIARDLNEFINNNTLFLMQTPVSFLRHQIQQIAKFRKEIAEPTARDFLEDAQESLQACIPD